jgi:hypothetical protein
MRTFISNDAINLLCYCIGKTTKQQAEKKNTKANA